MEQDAKTAARRWIAARRLRRAWCAARRCRATAGLSPDLALVLDRATHRWQEIGRAQLSRKLTRPVRVAGRVVWTEGGVILDRKARGRSDGCSA